MNDEVTKSVFCTRALFVVLPVLPCLLPLFAQLGPWRNVYVGCVHASARGTKLDGAARIFS